MTYIYSMHDVSLSNGVEILSTSNVHNQLKTAPVAGTIVVQESYVPKVLLYT